MPTRKQRRRRAKEQRHEYEVVYLDAEGNEVEVESTPTKPTYASRRGVTNAATTVSRPGARPAAMHRRQTRRRGGGRRAGR